MYGVMKMIIGNREYELKDMVKRIEQHERHMEEQDADTKNYVDQRIDQAVKAALGG